MASKFQSNHLVFFSFFLIIYLIKPIRVWLGPFDFTPILDFTLLFLCSIYICIIVFPYLGVTILIQLPFLSY